MALAPLKMVDGPSGVVESSTLIDVLAPVYELAYGIGWFRYVDQISTVSTKNADPSVEFALRGVKSDKDISVNSKYDIRPLLRVLVDANSVAGESDTDIVCQFAYGANQPLYVEFEFLGAKFQFWFAHSL